MSRVLSFKEEDAIRRARAVDIVCSEADGGRVFHLTAEGLARHCSELDLPALITTLIEDGFVMPGFVPPSKFLPNIIMRASPDIRQLLAHAMREHPHD
jgi:hypothetical protein